MDKQEIVAFRAGARWAFENGHLIDHTYCGDGLLITYPVPQEKEIREALMDDPSRPVVVVVNHRPLTAKERAHAKKLGRNDSRYDPVSGLCKNPCACTGECPARRNERTR